RALDQAARDSRARRRPRRPLDLRTDRLLRTPVAARRDAGEHLLQHHLRQRVAVGEVLVGREPHLRLAVAAADARPLDRQPPATERHLASLMAVAHRRAVGIMLALYTDDADHLLFHQLGEHAQPDADAQGEQPLLRSADQLPERLLHPSGNTVSDASPAGASDTVESFTAVPPLIFGGSPRTLPTRADEAGGTAVKFYEPRDNLARGPVGANRLVRRGRPQRGRDPPNQRRIHARRRAPGRGR